MPRKTRLDVTSMDDVQMCLFDAQLAIEDAQKQILATWAGRPAPTCIITAYAKLAERKAQIRRMNADLCLERKAA